DRLALQRLKDAAEKAKIELSSAMQTEVNLPFITADASGPKHLAMKITRAKLEALVDELIQRTIPPVKQALKDAGVSANQIDEVILVGGMTRMPKVQRAVQEFFKREPCKGVHPDEVVGLGAAIQASALMDEGPEMILLDVTPHTLGIMVVGGYFEALIPQNSTVPTSRSKTFTTVRENQTAVKILVLQGESHRAEENELLGEFVLTGLRRAAAGQVEVDVTFEINADGIVSVHAKDLETGQQQSITVTASSGLTRDEISTMMEQSRDFAVARRTSEESEQAKQEAERLIAEIEKLFPQVERVVAGSDFGRDAIDKARGVVARARSLIEQGDAAQLKEQLDALARTQRMFKGVVGKTG
ncbi:MAG TPA: Hsp70 family protein, partial [Polyangiales bacterium]|nr:Hsp70 family protein [Polyangiales bacterium]